CVRRHVHVRQGSWLTSTVPALRFGGRLIVRHAWSAVVCSVRPVALRTSPGGRLLVLDAARAAARGGPRDELLEFLAWSGSAPPVPPGAPWWSGRSPARSSLASWRISSVRCRRGGASPERPPVSERSPRCGRPGGGHAAWCV